MTWTLITLWSTHASGTEQTSATPPENSCVSFHLKLNIFGSLSFMSFRHFSGHNRLNHQHMSENWQIVMSEEDEEDEIHHEAERIERTLRISESYNINGKANFTLCRKRIIVNFFTFLACRLKRQAQDVLRPLTHSLPLFFLRWFFSFF